MEGRFWVRACIVNPLASESDVEAVFDALAEHGAAEPHRNLGARTRWRYQGPPYRRHVRPARGGSLDIPEGGEWRSASL